MTNWRNAILLKLEDYCGFDIETSDHHIIVSCKNPEGFDVSFHALAKSFKSVLTVGMNISKRKKTP